MGEIRNFDQPDEARTFDRGRVDIVQVLGQQVARAVFEPGWRWSTSIRAIAGTDTCQTEHLGYVVSGRLGIAFDDGTTQEIGAGDLARLQAGHDSWTIGDEPCVIIDLLGLPNYAVDWRDL